jgi:hypothetical protein
MRCMDYLWGFTLDDVVQSDVWSVGRLYVKEAEKWVVNRFNSLQGCHNAWPPK